MQLSLFLLAAAVSANIVDELVQRQARFSSLIAAVQANNLTDVFTGAGPLTLFAPTNEAFAAIAAAAPAALANNTYVTGVLTYHVLPTQKFVPGNASKVIVETALSLKGPGLNQLNTGNQRLVITVSTNTTNGNHTVVKVGEATVVESIEASNGIIHVIDAVLVPPRPVSEVAIKGGLASLVNALNQTGLVSTVDGLKGITIFAPIDAAFAALTSVPPADVLKQVLTYHVLPSVVYSTDIAGSPKTLNVDTVQGSQLTVTVGSDITVKGAGNAQPVKVIATDILVDSGVVHLIDGVLLPGSGSGSGNAGQSGVPSGALAVKVGLSAALLSLVALF